jgi:hypothetical protein
LKFRRLGLRLIHNSRLAEIFCDFIIAMAWAYSLFGNPGLEFRLQAVPAPRRLKAELRTPNDTLPAPFLTGSQPVTARLRNGGGARGTRASARFNARTTSRYQISKREPR